MSDKDYYRILGVGTNAEDVVMRAAYKALVQRYHPDRFTGSAHEAQEKMRDINEAYETLSNPIKRKNYDEQRAQQQSQTKTEQTPYQKEWGVAVEYYPDLTEMVARLALFSDALAEEYRVQLLKSKQFAQRHELATKAEQGFLEDYFGNNSKVLDFARRLLLAGQKQAAKELNETLMVLGAVDVDKVIQNISLKYDFLEVDPTENAFKDEGEVIEEPTEETLEQKLSSVKFWHGSEKLTSYATYLIENKLYLALVSLIDTNKHYRWSLDDDAVIKKVAKNDELLTQFGGDFEEIYLNYISEPNEESGDLPVTFLGAIVVAFCVFLFILIT